jgi:hypothetical protein
VTTFKGLVTITLPKFFKLLHYLLRNINRCLKLICFLEVVSMEHEFEVTSDIFERWTPVGIEYTSNCNLICVHKGKASVECHIIH